MISNLPHSQDPFRDQQRWYGTKKAWAVDHRLFDALHNRDPRLVFHIPGGSTVTRIVEFARADTTKTKKDVWYTFDDVVTMAEIKNTTHMGNDVIFTFKFPGGYDMNGNLIANQMIEVRDVYVRYEVFNK